MTVWVTKYYETDGYTYGCDVILGIFSTRSNADEIALRWAEKSRMLLENIEVVEIELDAPWEGFGL